MRQSRPKEFSLAKPKEIPYTVKKKKFWNAVQIFITQEVVMGKRSEKNTKMKIATAAWKLFSERGYDETTVEDIIEAAETSRGTFYHYFEGKDALLSTLSYVFDEKYSELESLIDENANTFDTLIFLNQELFGMVEDRISMDLLTRLYSTQLITKGEKHLLDRNRLYYRLLRKIALKGQEKGELKSDIPANEIVKLYALTERALLYDWCICNGEYSLKNYSKTVMPMFLSGIKAK